jgi:hypothetical protein
MIRASNSFSNSKIARTRRNDSGYSLLLVIFMVATMLILGAVTTESVLTEGRREREAEMVWRGEQYERAIGLYYRKFGRYPTKIEDLTKATNGVRFLRQAYTDPTNKADGTWRFIYIGPNGQLTGSNVYLNILQYQMAVQGAAPTGTAPGLTGSQPLPAAAGGIFGILAGISGGAGTSGSPGASSATGTPSASGTSGAPGATSTSASPTGASTDSSEPQPQPLGGIVVGGNIVGVGSSTKGDSLLVFQGGKTYDHWEFLWAAPTTTIIPGQPAPAQSTPGLNGAAPGAPQVGAPQSGNPAPGTPSPGTGAPNGTTDQPPQLPSQTQ